MSRSFHEANVTLRARIFHGYQYCGYYVAMATDVHIQEARGCAEV